MTQKELHNQRLLKEAQDAVLQLHTRRHFLKESAMGLGGLALGSFFGGCGNKPSSNNIVFKTLNFKSIEPMYYSSIYLSLYTYLILIYF